MTPPSSRERRLAWTRPADYGWGTGATALTLLLLWLVFGSRAAVVGAPVVTAPTPDAVVAYGEPLLVAGSAAPNQKLTIAGGDQPLGEVISDADGLFNYELTALDPGAYNIVVTALNDAGQEVAASAPVPVTVADSRLAEPVTVLAGDRMPQVDLLGGDLAFDASDTPQLTGTGMPGATIALLDEETTVATAQVDDQGRWALDLSSLGVGEFALALQQRFPDGLEVTLPEPLKVSIAGLRAPRITIPAGGLAFAAGQPVTLEGTGAPGATITVTDANGSVLGETGVDSAGQWALVIPSLAEGEYPLSLTQTTAEGQESEVSSPVSVTVAPAGVSALAPEPTATTAPTAAGATAVGAAPVVTSPAIGETLPPGEALTLQGAGAPGATITITDPTGEELGTAVVDSTGQWSLALPELAPGDYALTVSQTIPGGQPVAAAPPLALTVTADGATLAAAVVPPVVTSPAIGETLPPGEALTLQGTGTPGATITITDPTGAELGTAVVDSTGQWSLALPELAPGEYALTVSQIIPGGQPVAAAPPVALTVTADGATLAAAPGAGAAPTVTPGSASTATGAPAGSTLTATAVESAGEPITLQGTGTPGATITVTDAIGKELGQADVDFSGQWSFTLPALPVGDHMLAATQTTPAGTVTTLEEPIAVTVEAGDYVMPEVTAPGTDLNVVSGVPLTLDGIGQPGATIVVNENAQPLVETVVLPTGAWSADVPGLAPGVHTLNLEQATASGALVAGATPITVTVVEQQKPALTLKPGGSAPPASTALQPGQTISGTADPGARVEVYAGSTPLGAAQADASGTWYFRLPPAFPTATTALTIKTLDVAGAPPEEGMTPITVAPPLTLPVTGGSLR